MAAFWTVFTFGDSGPASTTHGLNWTLQKKFKFKFKSPCQIHGSILGSIHIWGQWSSLNHTWLKLDFTQEIQI
jgi:hypothetical protein